jgi:lipopolysaccharide/colanic/teichoic acid biosynthesis glycosyltransferase/SAM-dependent methyltransferase
MPQATRTAFSKRLLDLVIVAPLALFVSPFALVVAAIIKLRDRGPILYQAQRVGRGGDEFTMLKFRTMVVDAEVVGGSSTSSKDPRITAVGHTLRRWKLDELPQLINVLRGEMSLVGPRPQVRWDVDRYTEDERRLLTVRPGITDWASIKFRDEGEILAAEEDPDEAYDRLIRPDKIRLGLRYVDSASVRTDLGILRDTLRAVFGREPHWPGGDDAKSPPFHKVTEDWTTLADEQQWELARQRYSTTAALSQDKDLAEIGCGTGYGLARVAPYTRSAVGLDIDETNLEVARKLAPDCTFVHGSAEVLPFEDASLDCVVGLEMLYYVGEQRRFFGEVKRVLRPGGTFMVSLPNADRTGFSPSPFSTGYPSYAELMELFRLAGFDAEIHGACPVLDVPPAKEMIRRALVALHLMPRTIEGRAKLKRLLSREMRQLDTIVVDPTRGFDGLTKLTDSSDAAGFAILMAIGTIGVAP